MKSFRLIQFTVFLLITAGTITKVSAESIKTTDIKVWMKDGKLKVKATGLLFHY